MVALTRRQVRSGGRGVPALLADFGHDLPTIPPAPATAREGRLFTRAPRRGPRRRGGGWAPSVAAPVSVWRMTSDQAPCLWPFIAAPALPATGAQMGIDVLSGGAFHLDPFGWVLRDDVPVTNPNVLVLRQTRPRQVRHHQGVRPADDGLRVPHPDPGRPQGRVREPLRRPGGGAVPDRPRPPGQDQPPVVRAPGPRLEQPDRAAGPRACRGGVRAVAHPDPRPGRVPARRRHPGPVRAHRGERRQGRPARPDRVHPRPVHPDRDHHPRPVAAARPPPPPNW